VDGGSAAGQRLADPKLREVRARLKIFVSTMAYRQHSYLLGSAQVFSRVMLGDIRR
jgi:hypothetical protein